MKFNKNRLIGIGIIIISIVFVFLLLSFNTQLQNNASDSCACTQDGQTCAHQTGLTWQSYVGFLFVLGLIILGIYIMLKKEGEIKKKVDLSKLDIDEKKIFQLIQEADGTIFQSELVEKSQFDKVKVTRILDRLEGKQTIERRRRGMTNIVLIK
ncbi:MAG: MarR family transcriptional regulator [archaeon]